MATSKATTGSRDLRELLLWCRENGFRVHQVDHGAGIVRLQLTDLRIDQPAAPARQPRSVHEAFAAEMGIDIPDDPDDMDGDL